MLPVVQEVEAILGRSTVFYDTWYEHWIAGPDADLLLQRLYSEMAELVVVCVSGAYGNKPWTRAEHRAVRARYMKAVTAADRQGILSVRVGNGEVEGVLFNEIVPDFRDKMAADAAGLIVARLNLVRGYAGDVGPVVARWPGEAPVLQWPMADHSEARRAFARLLCEATPERALLVRGASEAGKSHMSRQMIGMLGSCRELWPDGSTSRGRPSMDIEIEAFSATSRYRITGRTDHE